MVASKVFQFGNTRKLLERLCGVALHECRIVELKHVYSELPLVSVNPHYYQCASQAETFLDVQPDCCSYDPVLLQACINRLQKEYKAILKVGVPSLDPPLPHQTRHHLQGISTPNFDGSFSIRAAK